MGIVTDRERNRREPIIESKITQSKDGRYLIHRTTIIHVMPSDYYRAVLANAVKVQDEDDERIIELLRKQREE